LVNLLSRASSREPFPELDEQQRARFGARARSLSGLAWPDQAPELARFAGAFTVELEELETDPSLVVAHDLLDRIDRARRDLLGRRPERVSSGDPGGEWLCFFPGRSLSTGEAEIASRGFFDVLDRPPVGLWVEAIARRRTDSAAAHELAIVCWVPPVAVAPARAGREACRSGALAFLEEASAGLARQVCAIVEFRAIGSAGSRSPGSADDRHGRRS
jgi:hypothetical protein